MNNKPSPGAKDINPALLPSSCLNKIKMMECPNKKPVMTPKPVIINPSNKIPDRTNLLDAPIDLNMAISYFLSFKEFNNDIQ